MALLTLSNADNIKQEADTVVGALKQLRKKTIDADTANTISLINLHHSCINAQTVINNAITKYSADKIGGVIAERFDFVWLDEKLNFVALLNTVIPACISAIEAAEGTILVGTFSGTSINYATATAGQQAAIQTSINELTNYLV